MEKPPEENTKNEPWDWKEYYELIEKKDHTKNLEKAINYCEQKDFALDLGAGNLRDTKFLLDQGFNVTAIDTSSVSASIAEQLNNPLLTMFPKAIREYDFPDNHFSLVNIQGTIFHFHKDRFKIVLNNIKKTLKQGGVFCVDFIGEKDDWNTSDRTNIILTKEKLDILQEDFEIKSLHDYEKDETQETADLKAKYKNDETYKPKHWHHIDIIAIKK